MRAFSHSLVCQIMSLEKECDRIEKKINKVVREVGEDNVDDVIKEVDAYKTEDGSVLKTSIFSDTVAQNGNEIYVGSKAGIPIGFNELSKAY